MNGENILRNTREMFLQMACGGTKWRNARVALTLAGDKWEVGGRVMLHGWASWVEEIPHGFCTSFHLFFCPDRKKIEIEIVIEDVR